MNKGDFLNNISFGRLLREHKQRNRVTGAIYNDSCLIINNFSSQNILEGVKLFDSPARLDAIIIFICTEGEITITCDLENVTITKGMIYSVRPGSIIQTIQNSECRGSIIMADVALMDSLNLSIQKMMPRFSSLQKLRGMRLTDFMLQYMLRTLEMLETSFNMPSNMVYYDETVRSLISSFFYSILNFASELIENAEEEEVPRKNRNEEYFRTFIRLVNENYREQRKITFYAEKMNITPKYLSTLIRHFSNHGPSEWIDMSVIMEAKNLLRYSDMSIQEIAYYLNFPTQSFFGRYFKAHTGTSPKAFRAE